MRERERGLVLVFAVSALAVACDERTLTGAELIDQANAACRRAVAAADAQIARMSPLPTPPAFEVGPELMEGFRRYWLVSRDLLRNVLDDLEDLSPPATESAEVDAMLESLRRDIAIGDRWLEAYDNDDEATLDELANASIGDDFRRRADAFGLSDCANLVPD